MSLRACVQLDKLIAREVARCETTASIVQDWHVLSVRKSRNGMENRQYVAQDNVARLKATMQTLFIAGKRTITVIDCCTDISHPGTWSTSSKSPPALEPLLVCLRTHYAGRRCTRYDVQPHKKPRTRTCPTVALRLVMLSEFWRTLEWVTHRSLPLPHFGQNQIWRSIRIDAQR